MSTKSAIKEDVIQGQILQAAKRLFAVHGLAKVTMEDVAKAIGKGRSTLYYYYKSKDEIFDAVIHSEITEMVGVMEKAVGQALGIEERMHAFFVTKLRLAREKGSFFDAFTDGMDADALTDFNKTKIAQHNLLMKMEGALLVRILNEGIAQNELKPIEANNIDALVFVLLGSIRGLRNEIRVANNPAVNELAIVQFTRIILQGLKK